MEEEEIQHTHKIALFFLKTALVVAVTSAKGMAAAVRSARENQALSLAMRRVRRSLRFFFSRFKSFLCQFFLLLLHLLVWTFRAADISFAVHLATAARCAGEAVQRKKSGCKSKFV